MSEIESQSINRKFVVVSDSEPASPFEGQIWRDTTSQTTKQYINGGWESIQTSPDGITLEKNAQGELQVKKSVLQVERKTLLGDFETDTGDWTVGNGMNLSTGNSDNATLGNYYLDAGFLDSDTGAYLERTFTVQKNDSVLKYDRKLSNNGYGNFLIYLNGEQIESTPDDIKETDWNSITRDVSDISGEVTIRWENNGAEFGGGIKLDNVRLETSGYPSSSNYLNELIIDGAGGTNET